MKPYALLALLSTSFVSTIAEEPLPLCRVRQREFCRSVADAKGNLAEHGLYLGRSDKSGLSLAQLVDAQVLVDSLPSLPLDLERAAMGVLGRLDGHLAREDGSPSWKTDFWNLMHEFDETVERLAERRAALLENLDGDVAAVQRGTYGSRLQLRALLAGISRKRRLQVAHHRGILLDEITRAKYEHHPNWRRLLGVAQRRSRI